MNKGIKKKNHAAMLQAVEPDLRKQVMDQTNAIARGRLDPVFFGEYFLGVRFHPLQKIWLWLTTKTQVERAYALAIQVKCELPHPEKLREHAFLKNILSPSNRFGKTFVTSIKHIWYNFYKIGVSGPPDFVKDVRYSTLNISPHSLQVDAAYRYVIDIFQDKFLYNWHDANGNEIKVRNACRIKNFMVDFKQTRREIVFANNSTLKGVPTGEDQASSLAGTQFAYISYDEAPQSLHLRQELPAKIQSRLIDSGGPLDIIGTPEVDKPSHAYYHRIVKQGLNLDNGFFTLTGALTDNIFIGDSEKQAVLESIKQTDPEKYRQVAFGDFITSGVKLFDNTAIGRLWMEGLYIERGLPDRDYIIDIDWGFSDTGDPTVIYVIDYTELRGKQNSDKENTVYYKVVYRESIKGGDPYAVLARVRILQQDFNDSKIIHDSSSMGGVIIKKMLREMNIRHLYDFVTAKTPKDEMLFMLVRAMNYGRRTEQDEEGIVHEVNPNFGKIRSYLIPDLEDQMGIYKREDKKLEQDEIMALGMGIWYLERKFAGHKTKVFDLNILADKPEQILKVADKGIKTTNVTIRERIIH